VRIVDRDVEIISQEPLKHLLYTCRMCFEIQCLNNAGQYAGRCNTANPVSVVVQVRFQLHFCACTLHVRVCGYERPGNCCTKGSEARAL